MLLYTNSYAGGCEMNGNNQKALIFAYYLSKFDLLALSELGFKTWNAAYEYTSSLWDIKSTTIKNMRDEFDPIMDNLRAGWYQKPLSRSRALIHTQYRDIPLDSFTLLIKNILYPDSLNKYTEFETDIVNSESDFDLSENSTSYSIQRTFTGLAAEEIFIQKHSSGEIGHNGILTDTRNHGCGYDFREETLNEIHCYEVKGRFEECGGILMTEKEWAVAKEMQNNYHLVLVSNISSPGDESIAIYPNPAEILNAKLNVRKVIQTSWVIAESEL